MLPDPSDWAAGKQAGITSITDLQVYGNIVLWDSPTGSYALDLATDSIARLSIEVDGVAIAGQWAALWYTTAPVGRAKAQGGTKNDGEIVLDLAALPPLPAC